VIKALLAIFSATLAGHLVWAADRPAVTGVRAADHDGVTRLVLELSRPVAFQLANDSDNRHLSVSLPELDWRADSAQLKSAGVGLVRQITFAIPDAGSGRLQVETNRPAVIHKMFLLPPSGNSSYRLVMDLEATTANGKNAIAAGALTPPAPIVPPPPAASPPPAPARPVTQAALSTPPLDAGRKERHAGKPIVVIDPGHGGVDPGAISLSGAYEKNIVLALARDLKEELDKGGKVNCVLTRDRDIFIPLRERVSIARSANADLFMSIHADTVSDGDIHGLSVYTLSQNASDAEAQALADKENKADIVAGLDLSNESPEVTNILIDLVQRESMNLSASFAHKVIAEVARNTHQLLQNTHRFAGFAVLKAPDVPSVLVESGYLSNDHDEQMLRRPEYRAKLAQSLARAIENFLVRPQNMRRS
jgi:N-acetylmuramoyl-L-alanine amidase